MCVIKRENQIKTPPELDRHCWSWSRHHWSSNHHHQSSNHASSPELLMFSEGKITRVAFFPLSFSCLSGKIRNEGKIRVHIILHDPFRSIPQKTQSRKDPSHRDPQICGSRKSHPNTVPQQSFTGQAHGPDPWLPFLTKTGPPAVTYGKKLPLTNRYNKFNEGKCSSTM